MREEGVPYLCSGEIGSLAGEEQLKKIKENKKSTKRSRILNENITRQTKFQNTNEMEGNYCVLKTDDRRRSDRHGAMRPMDGRLFRVDIGEFRV